MKSKNNNVGGVFNPTVVIAKQTYRVELPPGSIPGSFVEIALPDGRVVSVQVPPQVHPGSTAIDIVA